MGNQKCHLSSSFGAKESAAGRRKRDGVSYLAVGNNITPQRTLSTTASSSTIDLCGGRAEEEVIDSMVKRVHRRAFVETGVV